MLSQSLFYELKGSYLKNWNARYAFKDPFQTLKNSTGGDSLNIGGLPVYSYVHDQYGIQGSANPGFSTGGQDKGWSENWIEDYTVKFDMTGQLNKQHTFKGGIEGTRHSIHRFNTQIQNLYRGSPSENVFYDDSLSGRRIYLVYKPDVVLGRTSYTDIYTVKPWAYSGYLQDKMEFDLMVINLGLRYDYFNPNSTYPSDPRNPGNDIINSPLSTYRKAPAADQFSPRFGISYKVGDAALLRFSYGHFFQMPPLYALYVNHGRVVPPGDYQTLLGNPLVKPQRTIQYEAGLWQQMGPKMSFEVAVFYRDIYDLLGTKIIETYNSIKYGLYSNLDYGNARGLELKYDYFSGNFSAGMNYTLQYTRGNANSPRYTFDRGGQQQDPVNLLIPMDWDQRHTLNGSIAYTAEGYGGSLIGRYDSGQPYGWTPLSSSTQALVTLQPNNSPRPSLFSVDLNAFISLWTMSSTRTRLTILVYNIFDGLNETQVNTTTGRANERIILDTDIASYRSNFSTLQDVTNNPASYGNPRSVKVGIEFMF
jgi:outer membrane receptor protein involved in Fe transport